MALFLWFLEPMLACMCCIDYYVDVYLSILCTYKIEVEVGVLLYICKQIFAAIMMSPVISLLYSTIQSGAGTTGVSETGPNGVPSPAPSVRRETRTADFNGGTRLHLRLWPPLHYRQGQQASVPNRHGFRPLRVPEQAHPSAQVTSRLRPLRGQWHYHLHIRVAATQPQLGITPGLQVALSGGGRLATPHRRFSRAFRPLN
jgi:hypothetical protein